MREKEHESPQKRGKRLSAGTIAMLVTTALVMALCAGCVAVFAGGTLKSRAGETEQMVMESGVQLLDEAEADDALPTMLPGMQAMPTASAAAPDSTPDPQTAAVRTFTLAAGGTVCAPKTIREGAAAGKGEYDFDAVFAGLGDTLAKADLSIVTLETTTAGEQRGYGAYSAPAALLNALRGCGVDVAALATERALDEGYEGLAITADELTARGIDYAGVCLAGDERGGENLIGINGVQTAVLAYSYGLSEEGRAAAQDAQDTVCILDMARVTQDIRSARVQGADVVIVLPHWGTKNKQETPEAVRAMALEMAEAGADVILGTHPNVVQGTQRLHVTRADGLEYESVVCYSLGSLLTDARTEENTAGVIAHLTISYDPAARRVSVGSLACSPVYIAAVKADGRAVTRVIDTENEQALSQLDESGRAEAQRAAALVRSVTGQSRMEEEGQG